MWRNKTNRRQKTTIIRTHNGLHIANVGFPDGEATLYIYQHGKQDYMTVKEFNAKVEEARLLQK